MSASDPSPTLPASPIHPRVRTTAPPSPNHGVRTTTPPSPNHGVRTTALSLSNDGVGTTALSLSVPRSGPPPLAHQPRPTSPTHLRVGTTAPSLSARAQGHTLMHFNRAPRRTAHPSRTPPRTPLSYLQRPERTPPRLHHLIPIPIHHGASVIRRPRIPARIISSQKLTVLAVIIKKVTIGHNTPSPLVPTVGLEPTRPYGQGILSPLRLPIPPRRHASISGDCTTRIGGISGIDSLIWYAGLGQERPVRGDVLELVDRHDLGSCAFWREGSSPSVPTIGPGTRLFCQSPPALSSAGHHVV
jgi:hypothetical protein